MNRIPPPQRQEGISRLPVVLDWVWGRLGDPQKEHELSESLGADARLRADVDWARRLKQVASDLPLHQPPEILHQRLRQQFRRWTAEQPPRQTHTVEVIARQVFNSHHTRLKVGVRRADTNQAVQDLVWRTGEAELIVQVRTLDHERVRLDGQLLFDRSAGARVFHATAEGPGFSVATPSDEFGRFSIEVFTTVTWLSLTDGDVTIVAPIELGDR